MPKKSKKLNKLDQIYQWFIIVLPPVLYFSFHPFMRLGANDSMYFELSLPLLWLAAFDLFSLAPLFKQKAWRHLKTLKFWLFFPIWCTITLIWTLNFTRGFLTVGVLWALYFAIFSMYCQKSLIIAVKDKILKSFLISTALVCAWCFIQCILDIANVPRDFTLLCEGCTYKMFGFPHPNGFAIEPQFMGNLLLAPTLLLSWKITKRGHKWDVMALLLFTTTLFFTFSRGAIYAFSVAIVFLVTFELIKQKSAKPLKLLIPIIISFLLALNFQGIFAALSPTTDTYQTGIAKSLNHLSLNIIPNWTIDSKAELEVDPSRESVDESSRTEPLFDGYVAESTNTRTRLTSAALKIWTENFTNFGYGVGIGAAGQALYNHGDSPAPREIVQNQYASLLLETGLLGTALALFSLGLVIRVIVKLKNESVPFLLALILAYAVTLFFFNGLPNALHIYLLPALFIYLLPLPQLHRPKQNRPSSRHPWRQYQNH